MTNSQPYRIKTITEYHRVTGLPKPEHPLISVINIEALNPQVEDGVLHLVFDFYCIALKRDMSPGFKYGQQTCDFDEGVLFCTSPGQVFSFAFEMGAAKRPSGWMILVHPDFLWNTPLAAKIKQYEYFGYSVYEGLYLSDKEETLIAGIVGTIEQEYHHAIDKLSQQVMIAQLEVLLTYAERYYQRQFITRNVSSHQLTSRVEEILTEYFNSGALALDGLPTVGSVAEALNVSPGYLSELLKTLTGQSTQQHIHNKLIERAKEQLSTTSLSVSEIAYGLGFEHLQSFSKLFKAKTTLSPLAFRRGFN
jgi:AraC family transcriptional regulator, transcriptional activator of pobA